MQYLALLSLLAVSASAIVIEPIEPIDPIDPIDPIEPIEPLPTYVTLPGWPTCPDQCVLAVQSQGTISTSEFQVCFDNPTPEPPCSYYYCCGQPVSSAASAL